MWGGVVSEEGGVGGLDRDVWCLYIDVAMIISRRNLP